MKSLSRYFRAITFGVVLCCLSGAAYAIDLPTKIVDGKEYYYYVVKAKDTVFSLSRALGVTPDEIAKANPSPNGVLRTGDTLLFPVATPLKTVSHRVKKGETLFGISRNYDITPEEIMSYNKSKGDIIKTGEILIIPLKQGVTPAEGDMIVDLLPAEAQEVAVTESKAVPAGKTDDLPEAITPAITPDAIPPVKPDMPSVDIVVETTDTIIGDKVNSGSYKIAVMLPFMLEQEGITRQTQLYDDFFKGFLIAADTLSHKGETVSVIAYDTRNDLDHVRELMSLPEMSDVSVIIGPEKEDQLTLMAENAPVGAYVINTFNIRSEGYKDMSNMVQINLPASTMFEEACDALVTIFPDHLPVILENTKGKAEKADFVDYMVSRYEADETSPVRISFEGRLSYDLLKTKIDSIGVDEKLVFIPVSGTLAEFNNISAALKHLKEENADNDKYALYGYPDWTAFRSEAQERLHALEATVYSRFFYDPTSFGTIGVAEAFRSWFGTNMIEVVPCQALLGYDMGQYIIKNLRANQGTFNPAGESFEGLQSSVSLVRAEDKDGKRGGYVNEDIYIIRYEPEGSRTIRLK